MKAVILAGGFGTRISEESDRIPKPMVEIGGRPILWHILKYYTSWGISDFIICVGYKGYVIKEYFANYYLHMCDVTFDISKGRMHVHHSDAEPWTVTLVETGLDTRTGGRLKRIRPYLEEQTFCMTYGDGLSDTDIAATVRFHKDHGKLATVTAISPPGRFGVLDLEDDQVTNITEKPDDSANWINGGFFVLQPAALDYVDSDDTDWEREPMHQLTADRQLMVYRHRGFWQPMDTLREKRLLEELWNSGRAPWKMW